MLRLLAILAGLGVSLPAAQPVLAGGVAGDFDYYVLSLSWSADWCRTTGDGRHDPQCAPGRGLSFVLHGLWPQYAPGRRDAYPADCPSRERDPSRGQTAAMADIMGGAGLAWHEWQKHGRCSGLSAEGYFAAARQAYGAVTIPPLLRRLPRDITVKPSVIAEAFLQANPQLGPTGIGVTCERGLIQEVRICLTRDLRPRACDAAAADACRLPSAEMDAVR